MIVAAVLLLAGGLVLQALLLGANAYEAVVDVPNWREPGGVEAYRRFSRARGPAHFYRVLSPATIAVLAVAVGLGAWADLAGWPRMGLPLGAALAAEGFTVVYFFPRNRALFSGEVSLEPAETARLVGQWATANLLRLAIVSAGLIGGLSVVLEPWLRG